MSQQCRRAAFHGKAKIAPRLPSRTALPIEARRMFFLTPKFIKQGRLYIKEAEKRLAYNRDRWTPEVISTFEGEIARLTDAVKSRDETAVKVCEQSLDKLCGQHCPLGPNAGIAENVEVILVAIIVALGIRTYFLQPFTIPTSSMFPTLNGITGKATTEEPPNLLIRAYQTAAYGRSWHNVVAEADETVTNVAEEKRGGLRRFFTYTRVDTSAGNTYWINEARDPVETAFGAKHGEGFRPTLIGKSFHKGEPIARGYTDTGDHVFVDKFSYHFRKPSRGEVFVFTTGNIPAMGDLGPPPHKPSQFYIKRLAGVPGDELRIDAPELFHNDHRAEEPGFVRVMGGSKQNPVDDYQGYSNSIGQSFDEYSLRSSDMKFRLPERKYFALGDNSYNSSDSRAWGTVPQENLMGPGFFVYWPFVNSRGSHFGLIK
jgi:signal peptidase I